MGNLVVCVTPELPPSSHEKAFLTAPTDFQTPSEAEKPVSTHPSNAIPISVLQGDSFPSFKTHSTGNLPWVTFSD